MTPGDLANVLHVHPSTLTALLVRLQRRGLLHRERDRRDARRSVLTLSAAGARADRTRAGTVEARVSASLQRLSPREISIARAVIERLAGDLTPRRRKGR